MLLIAAFKKVSEAQADIKRAKGLNPEARLRDLAQLVETLIRKQGCASGEGWHLQGKFSEQCHASI